MSTQAKAYRLFWVSGALMGIAVGVQIGRLITLAFGGCQ